MRHSTRQMTKLHHIQYLRYSFLDLNAGQLALFQAKRNISGNRQVWKDGVVLKNHTDVAQVNWRTIEYLRTDADATLILAMEAGDCPE
jgi:hypothetical protein